MDDAIPQTQTAAWRRFWRWLVGGGLAVGGALYLFLAIVDPWGSLALSPDWTRVPADQNQRFSYPMVARDPAFDSLVIGTSTTRLLRPDHLNRRLGGRFANLSMNSATAYESWLIAELFLEREPAPRTVIVGIDAQWCLAPSAYAPFSDRPFPPWLYDDDPFNDYLHLFSGRALEIAVNQAGMGLGLIPPRYGRDGYASFLPDPAEYDLTRARGYIYGPAGPQPLPDPPPGWREPAWPPPAAERGVERFPAMAVLNQLAARLPAESDLVALVAPYHAHHIPAPWSEAGRRLAACKASVVDVIAGHPGGQVVDFMVWSSITREDRHYWDNLHYNVEIADLIVDLLARALAGRPDAEGRYRLLTGPGE